MNIDWTAEVRAVFASLPRLPDDDVVEELAQHAAAAYAAGRAEGLDEAEATARVRAEITAWCRDPRLLRQRPRRPPAVEPPPVASSSRLAGLAQDLRYAVRVLGRSPGHTLVAVLTMALGIGATTALFSVADGVLLRPLPWPDGDRLVRLSETREGGNNRFLSYLTNATYLAWKDDPSTLESLAAWSGDEVTLTGSGEPERLSVADVTPSLFPLIRARPVLGQVFVPGDERDKVVVLSYGLWEQRFGGDPDVLGRLVRFDTEPYRIVAVMPRDFAFPDRETRAWVPYAVRSVLDPEHPDSRALSMMRVIGRLRPGATPAQAAAEGTARGRTAPDLGLVGIAVFGTNGPVTVSAVPLIDAMTADVRPAILVFLAAVALLLATATANVASLQFARATTRVREIAIRSALGAGRPRLARQLLVESTLLGLAGGLAGLALAWTIVRALPALLPADFPRLDTVTIDVRVVAFAIGLALVTGVLFGLIPLLQARRLDLVAALAEDGLAPAGGGARSPTARLRAAIMAGQVAITCVLLVGAALLGRSFVALLHADRGYDPSNVLTAGVVMPDAAYTPARRIQVLDALLARLRAQPGVRVAAVSSMLPLLGGDALMGFRMPARGAASGEVQVHASVRLVSPGYFATMGIALLAGRDFTDADTRTSLPVVIVNHTFAERYLAGSPIGRTLPLGADEHRPDSQVVGVVDDVRQRGATDPPQPELYLACAQRNDGYGSPWAFLAIRTASDPAAFVPSFRAFVRDQDPTLALESVMTMEDRVMTSLTQPRLYAVLLGAFAVFALAIAGVGLFGVLSYSVAQRTREIGVRTALGARPRDIVRLVVGQGLAMTAAGLVAGLAAAFVLTRSLSAFLFGVSAHDPESFVAVPIVLAAVAIAASVVPARRAARVDPQRVLRAG